MEYVIQLVWDKEASVWVAINHDIPVMLESPSLDILVKRVQNAIPELIELNQRPKPQTIRFVFEVTSEVAA